MRQWPVEDRHFAISNVFPLVTCVAPAASVEEVGASPAVERISAAATFDVVGSFPFP